MLTIDDTDLVTAASEALAGSSDFSYSGDRDLCRSWGLTVSQHRDSGAAERSNYRCILRDLREYIVAHGCEPDDYVDDAHFGHWAVGWVDQMVVRVLIDEDDAVVPANITGAFRWVAAAALYLKEQYPIYDDSDYDSEEDGGEDPTVS